MKAPVRWLNGLAVIAVLGLAMGFAWSNARERGRASHCRNNLLWLGEIAKQALTEASLNPDLPDYEQLKNARGRTFWQVVWRIKLLKKPRELSPFACPFVHENMKLSADSLPESEIDYRGPDFDIYTTSQEYVPVAADRLSNHGGDRITVLFLRAEIKKKRGRDEEQQYLEFVPMVETIDRSDPRWKVVEAKTRD